MLEILLGADTVKQRKEADMRFCRAMNFIVYYKGYKISQTNLFFWLLRYGRVIEGLCEYFLEAPHGIRGREIRAKIPRERPKTVLEVECITKLPA